jgi:hypothetical protein
MPTSLRASRLPKPFTRYSMYSMWKPPLRSSKTNQRYTVSGTCDGGFLPNQPNQTPFVEAPPDPTRATRPGCSSKKKDSDCSLARAARCGRLFGLSHLETHTHTHAHTTPDCWSCLVQLVAVLLYFVASLLSFIKPKYVTFSTVLSLRYYCICFALSNGITTVGTYHDT